MLKLTLIQSLSKNIAYAYLCVIPVTLEKYWVKMNGYFIIVTAIALGVGITYAKLLFCHSIATNNKEKKIP